MVVDVATQMGEFSQPEIRNSFLLPQVNQILNRYCLRPAEDNFLPAFFLYRLLCRNEKQHIGLRGPSQSIQWVSGWDHKVSVAAQKTILPQIYADDRR